MSNLVGTNGAFNASYDFCPTGNDAEPASGSLAYVNAFRMYGGFYDWRFATYWFGGVQVDASSFNARKIMSGRLAFSRSLGSILADQCGESIECGGEGTGPLEIPPMEGGAGEIPLSGHAMETQAEQEAVGEPLSARPWAYATLDALTAPPDNVFFDTNYGTYGVYNGSRVHFFDTPPGGGDTLELQSSIYESPATIRRNLESDRWEVLSPEEYAYWRTLVQNTLGP